MVAFSSQLVRARMATPSHVAKVPLRKRTALGAGALPARSVRARIGLALYVVSCSAFAFVTAADIWMLVNR